MEVESPELKKLIFPDRKERPPEAPFMAWENSFFNVPIVIGMQRTAGDCSYKLSITLLTLSVISAIEPIPFTA